MFEKLNNINFNSDLFIKLDVSSIKTLNPSTLSRYLYFRYQEPRVYCEHYVLIYVEMRFSYRKFIYIIIVLYVVFTCYSTYNLFVKYILKGFDNRDLKIIQRRGKVVGLSLDINYITSNIYNLLFN